MPEPVGGGPPPDRASRIRRRVGVATDAVVTLRPSELELAGVAELEPDELDAEVMRLSVAGWSPWRIRCALGLERTELVGEAITRHTEGQHLTDHQLTQVVLQQLDRAIERTMEVLEATHYRFHKGELITMALDPDNPDERTPVVDDGPTLDAAKTVAVLLDRKAKLRGLDAPERHEHTLIPLPAPAQQWIAERRAALMIDGNRT